MRVPPDGLAAAPRTTHGGRRGWLAGDGFGWAWDVPADRWTRFWFPLVALALGLYVASVASGSVAALWAFLVLYHSPAGMYAGLAAAAPLGLSRWLVVAVVVHLHVFGALFVVWNAGHLKSIPWLGARLARLEAKGRAKWEARPRLRDLGFLGLLVFTLLPFPGTGALTAALGGRLAGLPWFPAWIAVILGGMTRVLLVTFIVYGIWDLTLPG